jgi:hypothetical protein
LRQTEEEEQMSPTSTRIRAFASRLAEDDAFRALVIDDPPAALAEFGLAEESQLVPEVVTLPSKQELRALGIAKKPQPKPPPPPEPTTPVHAQLFDPD